MKIPVADIWPEKNTPISSEKLVQQLLLAALAEGLPVAAWRLPNSASLQICVSLAFDSTLKNELAIEEHEPGFVFHPFEKNEGTEAYFIKADLFFSSEAEELLIDENLEKNQAKKALLEKVLTNLFDYRISDWHFNPNLPTNFPTQPEFMKLVEKGIEAIRNGEMEKVVPSRVKQVVLPPDFSLFETFLALTHKYPTAFVSLVSVPGGGTWLGASPEVLVRVDEKGVFRTVALAGTQRLTDETTPQTAVWRQKEIEEQAMVKRYILNCFKKIRLRDYDEIGPRTVVAGNLMHLKTDFWVCPEVAAEHPTLATEMLMLLHPTSAVCGMPKTPAINFLRNHEGYNRQHFSGFLGPVNLASETNIFVNLRCMQLGRNHAILYAGAGVTAESDPEKEWTETELKMQTIWSVVQQNSLA